MRDFNSDIRMKEKLDARKYMYIDLIFVILPFILLLFIHIGGKRYSLLLENTDWAIAATILSGQTLVRYYSGLLKYQGPKDSLTATMWGVLLLVLTFVCLVVFVILQIGQGSLLGFQILQIFLFIISVRISVVFGSIGQLLHDLKRKEF